MTTAATHIDLYQLTSLVPHWDVGLAGKRGVMSFFSRRLPKREADGQPARGFLVWAGRRRALDWLRDARFDEAALDALQAHPLLGPALRARPALVQALRDWRFAGRVWSPAEGTPLFAGVATDLSGVQLDIDGVRPNAQCPYLVVECDLLTAKLVETPLLSIINHMSMVASKAAAVVRAAEGRPVLEFGQRRTHPEAAVDAAYAAWVGGVAATSNVAAYVQYGVPVAGTMDHFAVQAWERDGVPRHVTERAFFEHFFGIYGPAATLLVDTYDTFGEETGLRAAVAATGGRLGGVRIDSGVTVENIRRARALLDTLGAPQAKITVSGGLDEEVIKKLNASPVDAYGVGERIVTSSDAPVGVGAVAKLAEVDGRPTMKLSRGSGKATLPGRVQVFRSPGGVDVVGLHDEDLDGEPLLQLAWDTQGPVHDANPPSPPDRLRAALAAMPPEALVPREARVAVSQRLQDLITMLVRSA